MDYMNFNCIPDLPYDTVYFKFTFVADTMQMLREGWMIDDIVFYTGLQANPPVTTSYGMRIYPNPVSDMMNLEWAQTLEEDLFIRIIDMQGKTVFTKISGPNYSYPLTLQLQDLQAGTYVLSVASGDKFFNQPFIKVER